MSSKNLQSETGSDKQNRENNSKDKDSKATNQPLEASFSALIMSLASSSLMWMGVADTPGKTVKKDKKLAMFNIDLLLIIREKTKGNLSEDESKLLEAIISDLQMRYVNLKDEKDK